MCFLFIPTDSHALHHARHQNVTALHEARHHMARHQRKEAWNSDMNMVFFFYGHARFDTSLIGIHFLLDVCISGNKHSIDWNRKMAWWLKSLPGSWKGSKRRATAARFILDPIFHQAELLLNYPFILHQIHWVPFSADIILWNSTRFPSWSSSDLFATNVWALANCFPPLITLILRSLPWK